LTADTMRVLMSTIGGIYTVNNPLPATGGVDA
jgi:hypothetical protein